MSDRRLTPSNGRVALAGWEDRVDAARFTEGELRRLVATEWLRPAPDAAPDRQLLFGDPFRVLEIAGNHAFGISEKDGYVGHVLASALGATVADTHRVSVRSTWAWAAPDFKQLPVLDLHMNARVEVTGSTSHWSEVTGAHGPLFVPTPHLRAVKQAEDRVTAAHLMIGTPYLWAGNTGFGIDCSGLVQAAFHAANHDCPADSDLQRDLPGHEVDVHEPLERGDLLFWRGHVAMVSGAERLIHANAHHMAVAIEPIDAAIRRIRATEVGDVEMRLRPE